MKRFPPYIIHHICMNNTLAMPVLDTGEKGNYLVFWWKDIALGHFFIEPDQALTQAEYLAKRISAIQPTIDFYSKGSNVPSADWQYWLSNKEQNDFNNWMSMLFSAFLPFNMPAVVPISVVICTRNRASHLERCLSTLKNMRCLAAEIVVVDNAPKDNSTKKVTDAFADIKYIVEPRPGLDIARNAGIVNAAFPIIAYVDDDVQVHSAWAFNVWKTFEDSTVDAITGLVFASELATEAQLIFEKHWSFNRGYTNKIYDKNYFKSTLKSGPPVWEIGAGANMAFRKSVFEKAGYFNEYLDAGAAGCSGDSEMWFRTLSGGHNIYYNPRAVVYHEHRRDMPGLKKQIFNYMRGFATAALIQQSLRPEAGYRKRLFVALPRYYRSILVRGFPFYRFQLGTIGVEILGLLSGLVFYRKNKKAAVENSKKLYVRSIA